jgi:hypothetical protein
MSIVVKYVTPLLLIAVLLFAQRSANPPLEQSEYDIYSAVIRSLSLTSRNGRLFIKDHTQVVSPATMMESEAFPEEILEDFLEKNQRSVKLHEQFSIQSKYHLISEDEDDGYGYVLLGVSRIGFNSNKNKSLVYVTYTMGGHSTKAYYFVLAQTNGRWVVQRTVVGIRKANGETSGH